MTDETDMQLQQDDPTPAAPLIVHLNERDRFRTVPLQWPVKVGDAELHSVVIRRLTTREVADFIESLATHKGNIRFPIFCDERGVLIPNEVWDQLDDDDVAALEEASADFLPRRLRQALDASVPSPGAPTAPSSGA
jgi:hypothetical protein